jgi:hypothetical protein
MTRPRPYDVVVVVPARDEEHLVGRTLAGLTRAVHRARGLTGRCVVEVAAHRCTDTTARVARQAARGLDARVVEDTVSETVGEVRDRAVRRGLARLGTADERTWVLSTDADTDVGPGWVVDVLTEAAQHRAAAVAGLAHLDRWHGAAGREPAYTALLARGHVVRGPGHEHDHVYGANLAVRADAYLAVGGFPHLHPGEDQALVDRLHVAGARVVRTRSVGVTTSGRLVGRAPGGLAALLSRLDSEPVP